MFVKDQALRSTIVYNSLSLVVSYRQTVPYRLFLYANWSVTSEAVLGVTSDGLGVYTVLVTGPCA